MKVLQIVYCPDCGKESTVEYVVKKEHPVFPHLKVDCISCKTEFTVYNEIEIIEQ